MAKEEKKEKVELKEISAVYKVHLHCPKCAHDIKRPLLRTQGVQSVDVKFEKGEVTVKGSIDEKKIHKQIEKLSKRKVEILPAPAKGKEIVVEKTVKETKQTTVHKTTIKVYMHCDKCEHDLRKKLLKHKGIHNVKTDMKAQTITIEGIIESEKLLTYMKKRVHKHAEIIIPKHEKKEEKKEKEEVKKEKEKEKEKEVKVEVKSTETTKIVEFKEEKKVEAKDADGKVPYFVHYVYAPQLFSDENPNACSIM
ncbi:heavy metal-associated isoprenylated plant protein 4 [Actinidia eriantha]|uniref:heavy metal-associated isoprenylated plant protein 4 n=1 Tax=Actinidia eriantha TaxID=165200 RepID=UPI0025900E0F|nr:heavy metal-associated isoprenylated plant protein 4 [Actinidia eriantha]